MAAFLSEDGADEGIDVEGLRFDLEYQTVVCEVGVWTVEHGEIGHIFHGDAEVGASAFSPYVGEGASSRAVDANGIHELSCSEPCG